MYAKRKRLGKEKTDPKVNFKTVCLDRSRYGSCRGVQSLRFRNPAGFQLGLQSNLHFGAQNLMEKSVGVTGVLAVVMLASTLAQPQQQQISNLDRGRAQDMLRTIATEVRKHYYDPKFH